MIAYKMISNVVPVLKREDSCLQALNWMEIFRVSHLPLVEGSNYLGLVADELIYAHGEVSDRIDVLKVPVEGTFVFEDYHIYDVLGLASSALLSVIPVLKRDRSYAGSIVLTDILHKLDKLLGVDQTGGIIILEMNRLDYSLAEVAQIVEYNEAKVLSCYVNAYPDSRRMQLTLKVNTLDLNPLLDTFIRYGYTVKNSFVTGQEEKDALRDRYGLLMKYLSV